MILVTLAAEFTQQRGRSLPDGLTRNEPQQQATRFGRHRRARQRDERAIKIKDDPHLAIVTFSHAPTPQRYDQG